MTSRAANEGAAPSGRGRRSSARAAAGALALGLMAALGGCHRPHGPAVIDESASPPASWPPPALEAGRDKGVLPYAVGAPVPPSIGGAPSLDDVPVAAPYRHDGARIEHSLTTGVTGTDHGP